MDRARLKTAVLLLLCSALVGCATPEPIFAPLATPIAWPSLDHSPRIAYVGTLAGEVDLKRPRSMWNWITDLVAGEQPPGVLRSAHGVAVTPRRVLYVSDPESGCVHRFDLERRSYRALTAAYEGQVFQSPIGLAVMGERALVADRELRCVCVLTPDGTPESVIGRGLLEAPVGIAVGVSNRVYVVDVSVHQIKGFTLDGRQQLAFGRRGRGEGEFNYPTHVACDAAENLYVSDSLNSRIQVFDSNGRFLRSWGQRGDSPGDFSQPKGVACDVRGLVYVVDSHFENIQVFNPRGELLIAFGEEGTGPGEFWLPVGICVDALSYIWVGDSFNRRVHVFRYLEADELLTSRP